MEVYGHRGAAGEAPENTIAGCRHAIERGVTRIEIDLQLSSDRQLVVVHDKTLSRTSGVKGKVSAFTAEQLEQLDARHDGPPWPRKKHTGISTLDKLLAATPEIEHYQLEVKSDNRKAMDYIADQLAERFATVEEGSRCVITSTNVGFLKRLGQVAPHLQRGIVATLPNAYLPAFELELDYFCLNWSICVPYFVSQLQRRGLKVSVWTVNEPQLIKNLYKMKVHSIITDYPSMALPLIGSLKRR